MRACARFVLWEVMPWHLLHRTNCSPLGRSPLRSLLVGRLFDCRTFWLLAGRFFCSLYGVRAEQQYNHNDTIDAPTGEAMEIAWDSVATFAPNPKVADFANFSKVGGCVVCSLDGVAGVCRSAQRSCEALLMERLTTH